MPQAPTRLSDEVGIALANLADAATGAFVPTLRLGVTGLSRAGKTIFITALIHDLLTGGRLPGFAPLAEGRFIGARLAEYPEAAIPRFAYEQHLAALTAHPPTWPESTRRISQLRLTLKYQGRGWLAGMRGPSTLNLDIVDYPGEWLLDLPLLALSFAEWSAEALARARRPDAVPEAASFLALLEATNASAKAREADAEQLALAFTAYLRASRADGHALSALPPGRFLMPGDLEGSPALTFAPLQAVTGGSRSSSLHAMLERRYEAYKDVVVKPFFRDYFVRLDRQIVLVDALNALNAGPAAVADLGAALTEILGCYRPGSGSWLGGLMTRRIDRILFAATKADHLHHLSHDRLEAILRKMVERAASRAEFAGATTDVVALAAVRATREASVQHHGETLPSIIGTPMKGEIAGKETFDGESEVATFPGDLPARPDALFSEGTFKGSGSAHPGEADYRFLRFRPPRLDATQGEPALPHIRLDRALQFLIGDKLQ
jgi:predicted YcjX-like family ATPase